MYRLLVWLGILSEGHGGSFPALTKSPESEEELEMSEVTLSFQAIHEEIAQATETAKKAKESACRISETIGLPPVIPRKA